MIVSDRDPRFTSRFWPRLQKALGTTLHFNTAFHLQIDGQSEKTIQTLKDMLQACVLEFKDSWVLHLSEVGEKKLEDVELIETTIEKIKIEKD